MAASLGQRRVGLPGMPTVAEQGFPGFDLSDWLGFFIQAGTPAGIVAQMGEAAGAAMRDPEVLRCLGEIGMLPRSGTPAEFAASFAEQRANLGGLIRAQGIRVG